ncbi:MAG: signal peptidase I [Candidatus Nanogingivalaceae bacterium]|jgi:signal peptidase I|nr:signal peptidase I [Candidatus Nanogingivalaceae bacterium]MCD1275785.1 signal peptidase I [Candidatus Nanogingivalaceae bacterium]
MEASYLTRHPRIRDLINFGILVIAVLIGTLLLNTYVFRSFSVSGHSMDNTLSDGDRLIINRIPVTIAQIHNKNYLPNRGQIIVFTNPVYTPGSADRYIVKRVIAFPGERVVVKDGVLTVYNNDHPDGFQPDKTTRKNNVGPKSPTSHDGDWTVPDGSVFVSGDNRVGDNSFDSRSGLGFIPTYDIIGPVVLRIFPLTKVDSFR